MLKFARSGMSSFINTAGLVLSSLFCCFYAFFKMFLQCFFMLSINPNVYLSLMHDYAFCKSFIVSRRRFLSRLRIKCKKVDTMEGVSFLDFFQLLNVLLLRLMFRYVTVDDCLCKCHKDGIFI